MSYHGTVIMDRAGVPLSRLPGIERFGHRHRRLRELGGGWQVLETSGWDDPSRLDRAVEKSAGRWRTPAAGPSPLSNGAERGDAGAGPGAWPA